MSRIVVAVVIAGLLVPATEAARIPRIPTRQTPAHAQRWSRTDRSAAEFMVTLVRQKLTDQNVAAWQALHPAHQLVAPLDSFAACQSSIPSMGELVVVRAMRVESGPVWIAGESASVPSKAVTVRVAVRVDPWPDPVVVVQTMHAVSISGDWRWILSASQYEAFSSGSCP